MEQAELVARYCNRRFAPGAAVEFVESCGYRALSRTITTARIVNGVAMIYVADAFGPVDLIRLRPLPRMMEEVI